MSHTSYNIMANNKDLSTVFRSCIYMTPQKPLANQCRVAEHEKTQSYVEFQIKRPLTGASLATGSGTDGTKAGPG